MAFRLSTLSTLEKDGIDYATGDLSLFPELVDDFKSLYKVANNAETKLKQGLPYNGNYIIAEDTSKFPPNGLIKISKKNIPGGEIIYYNKKNDTTFLDLYRGFAGSLRSVWDTNNTYITNAVFAEPHNTIKDAIQNMQVFAGLETRPAETSLNGMLKSLENKHLAPKAYFRAYPLAGAPPLKVRFQNFSNSESIRFLWDFGDGSQSDERNVIHTYEQEGLYTVKLNLVMSTGAQGITVKSDFILVSEDKTEAFYYAALKSATNEAPATYEFVDQTQGDIAARYWIFGDGNSEVIDDPNIHTVRHTYTAAKEYTPSLLIVFKNQRQKKVFLKDKITVI